MSNRQKCKLISPEYKQLSVFKQCKLIELQRSSYYFKPKGESGLNLGLMERIDAKYLECPFFGVERMTDYLNRNLGYHVDSKRIRRLYHKMNLLTIYPKPNLSKPNKAQYIYPYLLRNLVIDKVNQVWAADITYIPLKRGFMYMFAIIDIYSRRIMAWGISNTMTVDWCKEVLLEAIDEHGVPEIFNTDQGSQFTSPIFIKVLTDNKIKISMDGKGRALDNIFIERFWRTLKYEYIYLNPANGGVELYAGVKKFIEFYNNQRGHESLERMTPNEYYEKYKNVIKK
jgi:putative transposase